MTAIVDSKMLAYYCLHAQKPTVHLFDDLVPLLSRVPEVSKVVFVFDIGKSDYRLDLWHGYKGCRSYSTVPDNFKQIYEQVVPKIARALGIKCYTIAGVEADDLAGILNSKLEEEILLVTADQDWWQLLYRNPKAKLLDIKKYNLMDLADVIELSGCATEEQFLIKKCVVGDSGDRIIGVPTIGPVKYKAWADKTYSDPMANNLEFLKEEFLKLCKGTTATHKVHRDYMYAGVNTCEDLLDFNLKLGTIMKDLSLLSVAQKVAIKSIYVSPVEFDKDIAQELVASNCDSHQGPFGDPYQLSPVTIDYFRRCHG